MSLIAAIATVFIAGGLGQDAAAAEAVQLVYKGRLAPVRADGSEGLVEKSFDVVFFAPRADQPGAGAYWLVEESGRGGWSWLQRYGRYAAGETPRGAGQSGPSLLYEEGQTRAAIALLSPWTAAGEQLAEGRSWTIGETAWSVEGSEARGDDDAWRLRLDDATGPLGNVWVAKESGLIVAGIRTVVVNRGTEYLLSWDLAGEEPVAPDSLVAVQLAMDELIRLRGRLDLAGSDLTAKPVLGARSISVLAAALPAIQQGAKVPQVAGLLRAAADDIERQERRAAGVEELRSRFEGAPVVRFSAKDSTGRELSSDDLAGHVTVLHFWDYLDEPLEEPYGQVGYLEFLHSRREAEGVKVYGVAVNSGLADEDGRSGIVSSIRRFTSFMNLTYPVLLDAGELLKEFGDPRRTGAALPLYVVIGPDGTIDLYHVGFYEVDQQVGLKELDEAVGRLVEAGQK